MSYVCVNNSGRWFHDKISRKDAEKLLAEHDNQPGTFIVRESETVAGLKHTCRCYTVLVGLR